MAGNLKNRLPTHLLQENYYFCKKYCHETVN